MVIGHRGYPVHLIAGESGDFTGEILDRSTSATGEGRPEPVPKGQSKR